MLKYFNSRDELSAKAGGSLGEQGLRNKIELMQSSLPSPQQCASSLQEGKMV